MENTYDGKKVHHASSIPILKAISNGHDLGTSLSDFVCALLRPRFFYLNVWSREQLNGRFV